MKITLNNFEDVVEEHTSYEKFRSKKRKLSDRKSANKLVADESGSFTESGLEDLRGKGIVDEILYTIKSGKEATVYLGKRGDEYSAVKIYTNLLVRSFKKDDIYRQGRFIGDARIEKAIDQGSRTGLNARQIIWVNEEFRQMNFLYRNGIPVPKPIASSGLVVIMEFIGEDSEPAPRISDLNLEKSEAEDAFRQSLKILQRMVSAGKVHGDFSSFNLLLNRGKVYVIDFPQVINIESNISAKEILYRDVVSLCKSFKKHRVDSDPDKIFRDLLKIVYDSGNSFKSVH